MKDSDGGRKCIIIASNLIKALEIYGENHGFTDDFEPYPESIIDLTADNENIYVEGMEIKWRYY